MVAEGVGVWFDEWSISPGDSISGGIEDGLQGSDIFVVIWSKSAAESNWVGSEVGAYSHRRIQDQSLRIIPVMLDDTPLPLLVADYKGFKMTSAKELEEIASKIAGKPTDRELIRRLQERVKELHLDWNSSDPLPYFACTKCGSARLKRSGATDFKNDREYLSIKYKDCDWNDWTEL